MTFIQSDEKDSIILAIETSCDETSVAVVRNGREVLSNMVSSQIDVHQRFGGVVPEIASRKHVETITVMIEQAVEQAGITMQDVSAIAVTQGPGLIGALLVGNVAAKSLAMAFDIPLIGTHHIAGHIYANQLVAELQYPCMALVVSGGHTELVYLEAEGKFQLIGRTRDDAVGEAYDKVARAIGLPYPGGPHVDRLATEATETVDLPRSWLEPDSYDFSFSGLKSAVLNVINQTRMRGEEPKYGAIAHGFQQSVVDVLVGKSMRAVKQYNVKQLLLCGGVAANRGLREALTKQCEDEGVPLIIPPFEYCTDNAAMIGAAAYLKWKHGQFTELDFTAHPQFSLEQWSV
ncbi:tRNA (adenosine(37)-N6)-threonylcarbamoyltransferase complex transferase subunit TsaD [Paenibacillus sp. 481]|uniref:tRNA (adenosine(37)-N6)-threonylcarbamoyltransferase complex transferase subunit TsaD n=1 Tax=Paenibacillus sp. 481 TaxID=2835869 RepID=UPI001E375CDC|nr:tRNA (adenosine(37)-N6)-threonylcarbamoyltransferase complex transferase subunit TsaD [Paenibacillus sp. 481]UHA71987.1 tRNA (adenosine(37)-N6)-threonylcarbamoyltransferase complex transferase subunit TsaD [Paenibacillus sp. 481]